MDAPVANSSRIRYLTRFKMISPTFLVLLFAFGYSQTGRSAPDELTTLESAEEFHAVLKNPRVVVVVSASWSDAAKLSESAALQLRESLKTNPQFQDVVVCSIDCGKQQGEVFEALNVWLKGQNKSTSITSDGTGALVWVRKGKIVDIDVQIPSRGMYHVMTRTENAFIRR